MKHSRQGFQLHGSSSMSRKSKTIACTSCRKHKTRCELLDTTTSPIQCHRCTVIGLHCSYEETLTPAIPDSQKSPPVHAANGQAVYSYTKPRPDPPFPSQMPSASSTHHMWEFVGEDREFIDWSTPMLAIRNLAKLPAVPPTSGANPSSTSSLHEISLPNILTPDQIHHLLAIFDLRYTPWLNFKLLRNPNSLLLDTVCCTIAFRDADLDYTTAQPHWTSQLQGLTENLVMRIIFNPQSGESIEAIQALLILSLWEPIGSLPDSDIDGRDGRVLLASSISMAQNLRLNQASQKVDALQQLALMNGGYLADKDVLALQEMREHARLWISLTNAESILCIGTGRVPLSRRSADDRKLIEFPTIFEGLSDYRNLRLGLVAMQSTLAEEGIGLRINDTSELDDWYDKMTVILESLKRGRRFLLPLPVVVDHEHFFFHILHVYDGICRLLVIYHGHWEARASVGHVPLGEPWSHHFKPHGINVVADWGRDTIQTSEAILVYALQAELELLSTAPDVYFHMIALAAAHVVAVKFLMYRMPGGVLLGGSDPLLRKVALHLAGAARGPGHAARKCALLIHGMVTKWESRGASPSAFPSQPSPSGFATTTPPSDHSSDGSSYGYMPSQFAPPELDFSMFLNSTMALEAQLWPELQENEALTVGDR
ncbi:hypothetical protein B0H16DRAFT_1878897 [Mycena metata]|uniref:Zn(2)-C6 fungal-type domain-containing protein n=1 Tax=Mycena metata TaxID=1033252 RepID=A0AAD7NWM2_9AGAR|nr:hypothetical protein B0H16DRAFT_1878897 [Mycena metata]